MPRPKSECHSTDLDAEIARLEQERKRLIQSEDQRPRWTPKTGH
jgi:hypothetical protein